MLNKVKIIGECVAKNTGNQNILRLNTTLKAGNVIILDFLLDEQNCKFLGADVMQFDQSKNQLILLKPAPANLKSEFPSYQIAVNKEQEEQKNNIRKSLKKMADTLENCSLVNTALNPLSNLFQKEFDQIVETILSKIDPTVSNICTVRINGKLPGESSFFKPIIDHFLEDQSHEYYCKYGGIISKGENNACYICGLKNPVTFGFCSTYNFYSSNELAYIAGGFRREDSWKNYPVCPTCATDLFIGKEWIQHHFDRYFYGNNYLLLPAPTIDRDDFFPILVDIHKAYTDISLKQSHEKDRQRRLEMEEDIFETLANQKDQVTFTFLFYTVNNSEFKILQEVEEILPSSFQKIIKAKKTVENHADFHNITGLYQKKVSDNLKFNFGIVKTFFDSKFNNDFLDITTKILKNRPVDRQFVLHQIVNVISEKFRQNQLYFEIQKGMIFMKFLYALKLIENPKNKMEVKMDNKYQDYFLEHPDFYDADWKKAVFLLGVLAQNVMDIQWQERGSTPFRDRLNGLKIDYHTVKRLLPECINKLEQYKKNYYRELEEVIAVLLESSEPDLRNQSVDEISFYFAMGMNRNKQFKSKEEINEGDQNE